MDASRSCWSSRGAGGSGRRSGLLDRARPNALAAAEAPEPAPEPGALLDFGLEHWVDEGGAVVARSAIARFRPPLPVSYTHLRAHETGRNLVCRLLLEKK